VLVGVHRERWVRVTESLAHDLDRHARGDEQRCMGVADIVKSNARQRGAADEPVEELADGLRVEEPT
jgi:hypothetical protein